MNKFSEEKFGRGEVAEIMKALPSQFPDKIRKACIGCRVPLACGGKIEGDPPSGFWTLTRDDAHFVFFQQDLVDALRRMGELEAAEFCEEGLLGRYIIIPGNVCRRC